MDEHTSLRRKKIGDEGRECASIVANQDISEPFVPTSWEKTSPVQPWEGRDGGHSPSRAPRHRSLPFGNLGLGTLLLSEDCRFPKRPWRLRFLFPALDGQPIGDGKVTSATTPLRLRVGNHNKTISLHLLDSPEFPVVLGFPWLNRPNPHIDWPTGSILEWGPTCHATCLFFLGLPPCPSLQIPPS